MLQTYQAFLRLFRYSSCPTKVGKKGGLWQTNPPWDLVHQNVCLMLRNGIFVKDMLPCCHGFGNRFKTGFNKNHAKSFGYTLKEKPQTAVFFSPFLLGFRQLQRGALWMDGRSKPFTDMAGWRSGWISHGFCPVTVTGSGDFPWEAQDVSGETWMFQHLWLERTWDMN